MEQFLEGNTKWLIVSGLSFAIGYMSCYLLQGSEDKTLKEHVAEVVQFDPTGQYKMVLVVRQDLKMKGGKIAAQVGHAVLGAYKKATKSNPQLVKNWSFGGQAKVALKCNSEEEMLSLEKTARSAGLTTYIVVDAGRTQIEAGSKTVLAIGPGSIKDIDSITRHLKLL